jgi:hypothetical protein
MRQHNPRRLSRTLVATLLGALLMNSALAQTSGKSPAGVSFLAGGISIEELRAMDKRKGDFSLWLTTAAKGSGAHLADVKLTITDARKKVVFDAVLPGPWLMVDLPAGSYTLTASFKEQTQSRSTRIHKGDRHQLVLYFESPAEVSPDWKSPFKDNPYSGRP